MLETKRSSLETTKNMFIIWLLPIVCRYYVRCVILLIECLIKIIMKILCGLEMGEVDKISEDHINGN